MSVPDVTRAAIRALALIVAVAVAVVTLPTATAATVTCCCGEHGAGHDCGCADCPAGDGHGGVDDQARVKSCRSHPADVVLASTILHPAPALAAVLHVVEAAARLAPSGLDDRAAEPPPAPPPRD